MFIHPWSPPPPPRTQLLSILWNNAARAQLAHDEWWQRAQQQQRHDLRRRIAHFSPYKLAGCAAAAQRQNVRRYVVRQNVRPKAHKNTKQNTLHTFHSNQRSLGHVIYRRCAETLAIWLCSAKLSDIWTHRMWNNWIIDHLRKSA